MNTDNISLKWGTLKSWNLNTETAKKILREDGFAVTVGLMEYISGWSALEILYWLNEKQAIPRRYDNADRRRERMYV